MKCKVKIWKISKALMHCFDRSATEMDCMSPYKTVLATAGSVTSTHYPNDYNNDQDCQLIITLSLGSRVSIQFESFDIEQESDCDYDWLEIREGASASSPLIGYKLCGSSNPGTILSTGNSITLIFHSDGSVTASGFKLKFEEGKI